MGIPTATRLRALLSAFHDLMGWQGTAILDLRETIARADRVFSHIPDLAQCNAHVVLEVPGLPMDFIAILFAALAVGAVATGPPYTSQYFSNISAEAIRCFTGRSTMDTCLALYLQHYLALRTGSCNHAKSFLVQAVQQASDLRLQHNVHGNPGLQLYLLIYLADQ